MQASPAATTASSADKTDKAEKTLVNILSSQLGVRVKVSSGASKDAKTILDGSVETCWSSDALPPGHVDPSSASNWVTFKLGAPISAKALQSMSLTCAGGFSPSSVQLLATFPASEDPKSFTPITQELFPDDTNARQVFPLSLSSLPDPKPDGDEKDQLLDSLRLRLSGSTDDYGRITLYQVELFAVQ
ncbi:hypothetical protein BCV70DRAFT_200798 [Testicularia cyperi]|uniref:Galactose-binding like protein n=1 Tax=Testicularia cyperi TaxID=1882483 RepID=A0A317XPU5_9BASI|nr:hypothetical protein BCV70DRAFT_200798 [Testicularia cyperi]